MPKKTQPESTREQIKRLRGREADLQEKLLSVQQAIALITKLEAQRSEELQEERLAKRNAQFVAAKFGIEIDDEQKEHDRISVWPPEGFEGEDPHDGDHYVYSWREVAKRVADYAKLLPEVK